MKKPLGRKAYGSIGHLPHSRMGEGDHKVPEGMTKICHGKVRDYKDTIVIQEKLDGSNCAVAKINNEIIPLTRAGYRANTSPYEQHHMFEKWVAQNWQRFDDLLENDERIVGEWLAMAHGTKYDLPHEPFVVFDIMTETNRLPVRVFNERVLKYGFIVPKLINYGLAMPHKDILKRLEPSGHGAIDPVEGYVCRVERDGEVDFLAKWVRQDKIDGKYFAQNYGEDVWNYSD